MSHREFAERYFTALMANDQNKMREMIDPDFVITEAAGLPYAGTFRGVDAWFDLAKAIVGVWGGFKIRPLEFLGETADTLVIRFAISGKSRKTGKAWESTSRAMRLMALTFATFSVCV
jgi:ketosteroid isomerase-like protein